MTACLFSVLFTVYDIMKKKVNELQLESQDQKKIN